jgi:hypothetical protein
LKDPADRPDYRGGRDHTGFVQNLPHSAAELKDIVREAFGVGEDSDELSPEEQSAVDILITNKYATHAWNYRR